MKFDESCIFCKIVRKEAPASIVYDDETVLAFLDIRPLSAGHALVIPKSHFAEIFDAPQKQLSQVHKVAQLIAIAAKKATGADGISIIQQNGKAAGQDIFHLHVHIVPRFTGQKLPLFSGLKEAERAELDEMALKIRREL